MEPSTSKRSLTEETDGRNERKKIKTVGTGPEHDAGGIKHTFHGSIYEIKLQMLFLHRAVKHGYNFCLGSQVKDAKDFDDLVFSYKEDGKKMFLFLQAKHTQGSTANKITARILNNTTGGDFSMLKYFNAYRVIKRKKMFAGIHKDFIVCTNKDIDTQVKESTTPVCATDHTRKLFFSDEWSLLKITKDSELYKNIYSVLRNGHLPMIASTLATNAKNKTISNKQLLLFQLYRDWLLQNVFEIKTMEKTDELRFRKEFLQGKLRSAVELKNLLFNELKKSTFNEGYMTNKEILQTLSHTKFEIGKSFQTSKGDSLPLNCTDEEVQNFLEIFVLAVNQPNEVELGHIVEKEVGAYLNSIDSQFVYCSYQNHIMNWVKDKKSKFLTCQDGNELFEYLQQNLAALKLEGLSIVNMSENKTSYNFKDDVDVIQRLKSFLIDEKKHILSVYHRNHLLTYMKVYQTDYEHKYMFLSLEDLRNLQSNELANPFSAFSADTTNHLIIDMNTMPVSNTDKENLKKLVDIVQNKNSRQDSTIETKRIIMIIANEHHNIAEKVVNEIFQETNFKTETYDHIIDNENNFIHLEPDSQTLLKNSTRLLFQGKEVDLYSFIHSDTAKMFHTDVLADIISNKIIEIDGSPLDKQYKEAEEYLVSRKIHRNVLVSNDVMQFHENFFVHELGIDVPNFVLKSDREIILISTEEQMFRDMCRRYQGKTIHFVKKLNGNLIWQQTHGSLFKLREHVTLDQDGDYSDIEELRDSSEKAIIIAAEPGMGKSILLTDLAMMLSIDSKTTDFWVVKTILEHHLEDLTKLNAIEKDKEAIKLFYKAVKFEPYEDDNGGKKEIGELVSINKNGEISLGAIDNIKTSSLNLLRVQLFTYFLNTGKVVVLLDGFDEICPYFKSATLEWINILKNSKIAKVIITTRPYNVKNDLEDKLGTFTYKIVPLDNKSVFYVFQQYWSKILRANIKKRDVETFIGELKKMYPDISSFIMIPQHVIMVATVYQEEFRKFLISNKTKKYRDQLRDIFSLYDVYEKYLEIKLNILYKNAKAKSATDIQDRSRRQLLTREEHRYLALFELFTIEDIRELLSDKKIQEITNLIESIKGVEEKTGIIDRVVDGKPHFLHRTYAEFFAADLLTCMLDPEDAVYNSLARIFLYHIVTNNNSQSDGLFKFFNYKSVAGQDHILRKALNGELSAIEGTSENLNNVQDSFGRTPLHLIFCSYPEIKKVMQFMLLNKHNLSSQDKLFGWTPLHYAAALWCSASGILNWKFLRWADNNYCNQYSNIINKQDIKGKTALMMAIQVHNVGMCNFLIIHMPVQRVNDIYGCTALHYAIRELEVQADISKGEILTFNSMTTKLLFSHADVNARDDQGKTALHYAAYSYLITPDFFAYILGGKGDPNIEDNSGKMPLHYALENEEKVKLLLLFGAHFDVLQPTQDLPSTRLLEAVEHLFKSVMENNIDEVNTVLNFGWMDYNDKNILVNSVSKNSKTPLDYAFSRGYVDVVKRLLYYGAHRYSKDINIKNKQHFCEPGDVNGIDYDTGMMPLHRAIHDGDSNAIDRLLDDGAYIHVRAEGNTTILHIAATMETRILLHLLNNLESVDLQNLINAKNIDGQTPTGTLLESQTDEDETAQVLKVLVQKGGKLLTAYEPDASFELRDEIQRTTIKLILKKLNTLTLKKKNSARLIKT